MPILMDALRPVLSLFQAFRLVLILGSLWLAGCASQPGQQPADTTASQPQAPSIAQEWQRYQQVLGNIDHWQAQGKLGIRMPDHSGSAYFNWQQQAEQFAILLNGPLGQGATWIRGDDRRVSMEQSGQPAIEAETPEALMLDTLGWWLPVSELYYWVKGIPAPNSPILDEQHNDDGTLKLLSQNGWQLSYTRYQQLEGWHLPAKVVAQYRPGTTAGHDDSENIQLTFIIKDWQLH